MKISHNKACLFLFLLSLIFHAVYSFFIIGSILVIFNQGALTSAIIVVSASALAASTTIWAAIIAPLRASVSATIIGMAGLAFILVAAGEIWILINNIDNYSATIVAINGMFIHMLLIFVIIFLIFILIAKASASRTRS